MKKIGVIGIGYVGLSNAIVLAQSNKVIAFDINKKKVDLINDKKATFADDDVQSFLLNKELSLIATSSKEEAILDADFVVISTPTNYDSKTNIFNTASVEETINDVVEINPDAWIVIKSTVGIGFTKQIVEKTGFKHVLFSPEFLREGKALNDNLNPSRIIVGVPQKTDEYIKKANEFANLLKDGANKKDIDVLIIGSTEAEAVKLFSNTYLALRVSYFNELDTFARTKHLDTKDIIKGVSLDPRIGDYYNNPSFGYGGYCLPKDTKELKSNYEDIPQNLISACIDSNNTRKEFIVNEILNLVNKNDTVGIYRLTMKTNGDDIRESSVIDVALSLKEKGINIIVFEPLVKENILFGLKIENDFDMFVNKSKLIVANRIDSKLKKVDNFIYSCDLFNRD